MIKPNLLGVKIPKENVHYTCKACVTIDSALRMETKRIIHKFIWKNPNTELKRQRCPNS